VGKYQHLKKEKKQNVKKEAVINLDALDQEISSGMPID
jgi:hypothetical protein